jgi:hypothetical protein
VSERDEERFPDLAAWLRDLRDDLLTLKISTIVQSHVDDAAPLAPADALADLHQRYEQALFGSRGAATGGRTRGEKPPSFVELAARSTPGGDPDLMREEGVRADAAVTGHVRRRLGVHAAELQELAAKAWSDEPLSPPDRVRLYKLWYLGTDPIAMQTVIQLSGDVITRIQPEHVEQANAPIIGVHQEAVKTSISVWSGLVDVLGRMASSLVGASKRR